MLTGKGPSPSPSIIGLIVAGWVLGFESIAAINSSIAGAVMTGLALVRGAVKEHFGGGWSALWRR